MDYDVEMLKLYFEENNFTENEKKFLLNKNPFDENYSSWEKQSKRDNRIFAHILKKETIIPKNTKIQEISIHKDNSVGKYLQNNEVYHNICSIDDNLNKILLTKNLLLIKGFFHNEKYLLQKSYNLGIPFIAGICSTNNDYYTRMKNFYVNILNEIKDASIIEKQNHNQKIIILNSQKNRKS